MKDKPTFYGIIPANVRYAKIADRAKLIFSEITALSNKWGYCNASNGYFAEVWECDPSVISRHVSTLESIGAVRCVYIREGKQVKERRIYPLAMGGVLHQEQEGIAPDALGVLHPMQEGIAPKVKENTTSNNTTSNNINEELQKEKSIPLDDKPKKVRKPKEQVYKIFPPTLEEIVPLMYAKIQDKKRVHTNIVDCWNNANMQAEKFILHHEGKGWKIERLNSAIALWVNNAIGYGQLTKPCPIQYKNNPDTQQPTRPTQPVQQERPVLTQQDIEATAQNVAAVSELFKNMGVRV